MSEAKRFASGCVASPHYLASSAGLAVLASGGNAVDAALAVNLTLAVVAPYTCGFGGDLFAIVWDGSAVHAYNGSGRSPAASARDAAAAAIGGDRMPGFGPHTVTVPGAVDAWFALLDRFGTRSFADLVATPLAYARDGFPTTARGAATLRGPALRYRGPEHDEWSSVYAGARPGELFRQPGIARTIEALCERGREAYYNGEIGRDVAAHLSSLGALMTPDDLADHSGDWVQPLRASYRGVEVLEMPPNTQGVTALEMLNIAGGLAIGDPGSPERHHLLIEAAKLALEDRAAHVTDPDHMRVPPEQLASREWADQCRALIDPLRARRPEPTFLADQGTAYMCAADRNGMCVSLIQSNFSGFGSGVTVPGWGINLQNRGASFSLNPSDINVIAPRKRPMHTLIPAMALRDERPWLVFGSMGGHGQAQTHLQLLTRIVDDGMDVQGAIDAPRWMVSPADWVVRAESRLGDAVIDGLAVRGHDVETVGEYTALMGHAHAILVEADHYAGATDPRAEGAVLGR